MAINRILLKGGDKMDYFYAQLDENNICIGLSQLSGEINSDNMVRLSEDGYSSNLLNLKYDNGGWLEAEPPEYEPQLTEPLTEIKENQLMLMMAIADLYETIGGE